MLNILDDEAAVLAAPADAEFRLSENAARKVKQLLSAEQTTKPVKALRVGVRGGGCNGYQYFMEFAEAPQANDRVFAYFGVDMYIDTHSLAILNGGALDFSSGLRESGFKWINPNQKKSCGCGESFSI